MLFAKANFLTLGLKARANLRVNGQQQTRKEMQRGITNRTDVPSYKKNTATETAGVGDITAAARDSEQCNIHCSESLAAAVELASTR